MKSELEAKQLNYEFDTFRVDTSAFRLLNGDVPVSLEPKALQLLVFLIENRGRLLEKQQILDAVWGELAVTENALTREIAILRRVLGDDTRQPRFIETVPTRGYRFIAEVRELPPQAAPVSPTATRPVDLVPPPRRTLARRILVPLGISIVIVLGMHELRRYLDKSFTFPTRSASRLAQVSFSSGLDVFPSFSPDGTWVAYSSDPTGNFEIYVRALSPQPKELQITNDGQANVEPAYSPDGQWIAYHSRIRNGIWIVPALGGVARRITEFGSRPAWSHDGTRIAFESGDLGAIMETEAGSSPDSSIWIVNVADGSLHQVTRASDTRGPSMFGHSTPQWTPDDRRLLFAALWEMWTVSIDGRDLRSVAPGVFGYDPVVTADGNIVFIGGSNSESGIWKIPVDFDGRATGAPRLLHSVPPGNAHFLAVDASGRRIAFSQMSTRDNLLSVSLGKGLTPWPMDITRDTRLRKTNPRFSPDGKRICFGVAQVGQPNQIWIADTEGKSAQQIPVGKSLCSPGWLSNDELAYWVVIKNSAQLWKWSISQGRASLIFDSGQRWLEFARLSPDGRTAVFQRNDQATTNVWSISTSDKEMGLRQLTFSPTPIGWPAWSHDGKMLALEVKTGADTNIGVMASGGGPVTMITHDAGQNWPYSWSPDDGEIAFAAFRNGSWNVFSVSRKTGMETQLTKYKAANTFVRYPEWSPTGRQIVYEYGETTGNIWMLESK